MENLKKNLSPNGFTLLELTITIGIFIIIVFAWNDFALQSFRSASFGQQQLEAIRQAQMGIEIMAKELRELALSDNGSYPLELADDQEIIFYSDIDQDIYSEKVRYFLDGNLLKKGVIEPSGNPITYDLNNEIVSIVATNVRNENLPIFIYYNGDYPADIINNPLPSPARLVETKLIHVFLRINIDPLRAPNDFDLETDVQLRNLKTNL